MTPAISVSRVACGQTKIKKKLTGGIRIALAQYRELAAFAQFAVLTSTTPRASSSSRGQRVTELMKAEAVRADVGCRAVVFRSTRSTRVT